MRRRRLLLALLLLLLALLSAVPAGAIGYYPAYPTGTVGISRPVIGQQLLLGPGDRVDKISLWLDGKLVSAKIDATGEIRYVPPTPLAPGVHQVKLVVQLSTDDGRLYQPLESNFSFTVAQGAVPVLPEADATALQALARVNSYRQAAGLPIMVHEPSLAAAAAGHAVWMHESGVYAHEEVANTPGFIGVGPGDRTAYFGYTGGGVSEVLHEVSDPLRAVDDWMGTLYHRTAVLRPGNTEMGFGRAGRYAVINAGPWAESSAVAMWPHSGQTAVPTTWDQGEIPDPLRLYPDVKRPVGPVISLTFGGPPPKRLTLETATLTGPDGQPLPVMTFSPTNDSHLVDTVSIIPKRPLAAGTTYHVRLSGLYDAGAGAARYDQAWSFTTGAAGSRQMTPGLSDITGHWAETAIRQLAASGIVTGYPDGTFQPSASLTRAAFVKMLVAAQKLPLAPGQTGSFVDTAGNWVAAQGYLGAAVTAGIVVPAEYPERRFEPDRAISREEIAVMVVRALGLGSDAEARQVSLENGQAIIDGKRFADAALWRRPGHIATAVEQGIVTGYAESDQRFTFRPADQALRAEAAVMLHRMLERQ